MTRLRPTMTLTLVLAAACVAGACSGGNDGASTPTITRVARSTTTEADPLASVIEREKALAAMREQFELIEKEEWGPVWDRLHPAQQAVLSKEAFAASAATRWGSTLDLRELHLIRVTSGRNDVPGTAVRDPGFRIEARLVGEDKGGPFDGPSTYVEFKVDDGYRWAVKDPAAYQGGQCPPDDDSLR
jgi:hypothetical protein